MSLLLPYEYLCMSTRTGRSLLLRPRGPLSTQLFWGGLLAIHLSSAVRGDSAVVCFCRAHIFFQVSFLVPLGNLAGISQPPSTPLNPPN